MDKDNSKQPLDNPLLKDASMVQEAANILYKTAAGKIYAKAMLKACGMFAIDTYNMSNEQRLYRDAQRDFVKLFLTNLVDNSILLDILEKE